MRQRLACAALALAASGCAAQRVAPVDARASPADRYGDLFAEVQMRQLFADGKTFVDAVPKRDPAQILNAYHAQSAWSDAALTTFIQTNFDVPQEAAPPAPRTATERPPILQHIRTLWDTLTRPAIEPAAGSSALALPAPHVVPGGRFREMYYWDSYFTMLGLQADGRDDLIEAMLANFVSLVERYGHVPNGTRNYYLSRSQPPFLYLMLGLSDATDRALLGHRLDALIAEHRYWMRGRDAALRKGAAERVVRMPDGTILNRYWDNRDTPRDESFREDVETARASGRKPQVVQRDLRAGAESGWDFSSRWLVDGRTLATIDTTNMVPVDLNSLLYGMERDIAARCLALARACAREFAPLADSRRAAIERWLWVPAEGRYGDWDIARRRVRAGLSAATAYPLFTGVAAPDRAAAVAATIDARLIAPGGLRTSLAATGQQWDAPNGWAPLQWVGAQGLLRYGHDGPARRIAVNWFGSVQRTYLETGKLVEKYDVETVKPGGGGEYPLQDGFGWTNGVTRAMVQQLGLLD